MKRPTGVNFSQPLCKRQFTELPTKVNEDSMLEKNSLCSSIASRFQMLLEAATVDQEERENDKVLSLYKRQSLSENEKLSDDNCISNTLPIKKNLKSNLVSRLLIPLRSSAHDQAVIEYKKPDDNIPALCKVQSKDISGDDNLSDENSLSDVSPVENSLRSSITSRLQMLLEVATVDQDEGENHKKSHDRILNPCRGKYEKFPGLNTSSEKCNDNANILTVESNLSSNTASRLQMLLDAAAVDQSEMETDKKSDLLLSGNTCENISIPMPNFILSAKNKITQLIKKSNENDILCKETKGDKDAASLINSTNSRILLVTDAFNISNVVENEAKFCEFANDEHEDLFSECSTDTTSDFISEMPCDDPLKFQIASKLQSILYKDTAANSLTFQSDLHVQNHTNCDPVLMRNLRSCSVDIVDICNADKTYFGKLAVQKAVNDIGCSQILEEIINKICQLEYSNLIFPEILCSHISKETQASLSDITYKEGMNCESKYDDIEISQSCNECMNEEICEAYAEVNSVTQLKEEASIVDYADSDSVLIQNSVDQDFLKIEHAYSVNSSKKNIKLNESLVLNIKVEPSEMEYFVPDSIELPVSPENSKVIYEGEQRVSITPVKSEQIDADELDEIEPDTHQGQDFVAQNYNANSKLIIENEQSVNIATIKTEQISSETLDCDPEEFNKVESVPIEIQGYVSKNSNTNTVISENGLLHSQNDNIVCLKSEQISTESLYCNSDVFDETVLLRNNVEDCPSKNCNANSESIFESKLLWEQRENIEFVKSKQICLANPDCSVEEFDETDSVLIENQNCSSENSNKSSKLFLENEPVPDQEILFFKAEEINSMTINCKSEELDEIMPELEIIKEEVHDHIFDVMDDVEEEEVTIVDNLYRCLKCSKNFRAEFLLKFHMQMHNVGSSIHQNSQMANLSSLT